MTSGHSIDYETLQSDAMRGVVRAVLARTAKSGLPGDHHFYVSFDTGAPGVGLSKRLKEKYPSEMTIVLQHRFWDLIVTEDRFEVKLTFDGIPERLVVPFAALKVFFDPSVRYGLQFEDAGLALRSPSIASNAFDEEGAAPVSGRTAPKKSRAQRKSKTERESAGNAAAENIAEVPRVASPPPATATTPKAPNSPKPATAAVARASAEEEPKHEAPAGAQIVSLDQFRKK